ncbi:MAG: S-layer homology domain-containing protein [Negativicutes bacterium]|nr:S-layer homology domain-containing protein [Negativicutes bacterium]
MKKKLIGLFLVVLVAFLAIRITIVVQASGGDPTAGDSEVFTTTFSGGGTQDNPWLIATAEQLEQLANQVNSGNRYQDKYLTLANDIVLDQNSSWLMIGSSAENSFQGTLDGGGHRISGLLLSNPDAGEFQGLFGYNTGTIHSLRVESAIIRLALPTSGNRTFYAGILAGCNGGTIADCCSTGSITMTGKNLSAGGIAGQNLALIQSCYFNGSLTVQTADGTSNGGGIAGSHTGTIRNCFNAGTISASSYAGGITGISFGGAIKTSYNSGTLFSAANSGGISGANLLSALTENCYYLESCGGRRSGTALTAAEMTKQSSFIGFDFAKVWAFTASALPEYPHLAVFAANLASESLPLSTAGQTADRQQMISKLRDLDPAAWYYAAVVYCLQNGYINGMSETEFAPELAATRVMLVEMLANIAGIDRLQYNEASGFTDVATGKWYSAAIQWAAESEIVSGMNHEIFAYNAGLTRQQAAMMLYRFAQLQGLQSGFTQDARLAFTDGAATADWAADAMDWAVGRGILAGTNRLLEPQQTASRADVAQYIYRLLH